MTCGAAGLLTLRYCTSTWFEFAAFVLPTINTLEQMDSGTYDAQPDAVAGGLPAGDWAAWPRGLATTFALLRQTPPARSTFIPSGNSKILKSSSNVCRRTLASTGSARWCQEQSP